MLVPNVLNIAHPQRESQDSLLQIFIDFLHGDRSTQLYNFLYRDELNNIAVPNHSGITGWDKALVPNNQYYIYSNEVDLIERSMDVLAELPYQPNLIELGIGSPKAIFFKTIPIINALKPQKFFVNDISSKAVAEANTVIKEQLPSLSVESIHGDFLDTQSELYGISNCNLVMTGSTVSNITFYNGHLPVNEVVTYLKKLGRIIGKDGTFVITQDTNQDKDSIVSAYSEPDLIKFRIDMLYRVSEFLGVKGFDLSSLSYEPIWEPGCHLLANAFVNTKDQDITIGHTNISLPAGQRFYVSNCYKYPAIDFLYMAQMAGLRPVWSRPDRDNRVVMHALRQI